MEKKIKIAVITVSTRSNGGERKDTSGPTLCGLTKEFLGEVVFYEIVPDDKEKISAVLIKACDKIKADVVFTTGGTGLAPSDITPEATEVVIDKRIPGISEAMRIKSLNITAKAMLSRAVSGIRGNTLIINMPGSEKAVRETFQIVKPVLMHAVLLINGQVKDCGQ